MTTSPDAPRPGSTSSTPSTPLGVRRATPADRTLLERLWPVFRHDMSDVSGELPGPDGRFRDDRLLAALDDLGRDADADRCGPVSWRAYLATTRSGGAEPRPVAFALVRGLDAPVRVLSAFFVVRPARRSGVGLAFASAVLRDVPGRWEIAFQDANQAAARFWPRVARSLAGDSWDVEHRPVPGRPEVPADAWLRLTVA